MKRIATLLAISLLLVATLSYGDVWSIGIYIGTSPHNVKPSGYIANPVLTGQQVAYITASFVADPFIVNENGVWYMFFEAFNSTTNNGEIGCATSSNGFKWDYQKIVLKESFHLSYPYVFKWNGHYYMIPESYQANSIRLYKATSFPDTWSLESTLISGGPFVDTNIMRFNNKWWLFTSTSDSTLLLYYSDTLLGPWTAHHQNPIVSSNPKIARTGGRMTQYNGKMYRYAQDDSSSYGNRLRVFEINELTTTTFQETEISESPVLSARGFGWNRIGMHQLDPHQLDTHMWIASVDGKGAPTENPGIPYTDWNLTYVDSEETNAENGTAINSFDGNAFTFWHTEWAINHPPPPHEIDVNLGGTYLINGFRYLPRQDGCIEGLIKDYELYVSMEGIKWGYPVPTGQFSSDTSIKKIKFNPKLGHFIRLKALSEANGKPWTSMAAVGVLGLG